jgi:hypothetical protein
MKERAMPSRRPAPAVLEQEFLPIRAKILEVAAALDRLDRANGSVAADQRHDRIQAAIKALLCGTDDRAEQVQLIFSRQFEQDWRSKFNV